MPDVIKEESPRICEPGSEEGLFLPQGGDWEANLPDAVKVIMYLIGLFWLFLGVSIICDTFMGAIERITAKKKRVINKSTGHAITVKVWNDTVANLTLMALGSSAPEILLSIIELLKGNLYSGKLGPSTIVGSAAFNLLCITAVCVSSIPSGEVRKIKDTNVFLITAICSIFAYFWLLIILVYSSEDYIEIWEAALTLAFFPMLVFLAYLADIGYFSFRRDVVSDHIIWSSLDKEQLAELEQKIRAQNGTDLSDEDVREIMEREYAPPVSRAEYRVAATRNFTGGLKIQKSRTGSRCSGLGATTVAATASASATDKPKNTVEFSASRYAVIENVGTVNVSVHRKGDCGACLTVQYRTRDGSAKAGSDYEHVEGKLVFQPTDEVQQVAVKIVNDNHFEPDDEEFYIDLVDLECSGDETFLGSRHSCAVVIIDDDGPGVLSFEKEDVKVQEKADASTILPVVVKRLKGSGGEVSCKYSTEDDTAIAGADYVQTEGTLVFKEGQIDAAFEVEILPRGRYERTEQFRVVLTDAQGGPPPGASFQKDTDGGADSCILTVIVEPDEQTRQRIDQLMTKLQINWDKAQLGTTNWCEQFRQAIYVNGSPEDQAEATIIDWFMHIVTIFWKLLFALVPPTDFMNGWLCFFCALVMIGVVTGYIADMASLLGCSIPISDEITAITFVALGTSLPDTLASKTAAVQDPFADASVGNITGSNSVNVFLGLGLPWLMGAVFWHASGPTDKWVAEYPAIRDRLKPGEARFAVPAGTLSFSVLVFTACAITTLCTLAVRRKIVGAELGGPNGIKYATSALFVSLWFLYIGMSIYKINEEAA